MPGSLNIDIFEIKINDFVLNSNCFMHCILFSKMCSSLILPKYLLLGFLFDIFFLPGLPLVERGEGGC